MLAYCCDGDGCSNRSSVDNGVMVLPGGWTAFEMEVGSGNMNNPKHKKHLCPRCSEAFKRAMSGAMSGKRELPP